MAARDLVFEAGDRVRTLGRFVAGPDGDWLDLDRVHSLISKPPGWKSDRSIRLIGADAEAVPTDWAANRVAGYVSVVGTWRDESIEVEAQSLEIPAREGFAGWTDPPCPPPPGGWRRAVVWDLDFGDLESSGAMVTRVIFRPSADQEVLVVATTDVDAVTRQLSQYLPDQLCVVPSRFTSAQLGRPAGPLAAVAPGILRHWRGRRRLSHSSGPNYSGSPPRWPIGPTVCPMDCSASAQRSALPDNPVRHPERYAP